MGRKHKHFHDFDLAHESEREKQKIKETVLQVFRSRLESPDGGGAILIGRVPTLTTATSPDILQKKRQKDSQSSSSSDRNEKEMKHARHKRSKKAAHVKPRSDKAANHNKILAKTSKGLHDIGYARPNIKTRNDVSCIPQSRLTKKLGLFNLGKKSVTSTRDIPLTLQTKKKTEEALRKIIGSSDSESHDVHLELENKKQNLDLLKKREKRHHFLDISNTSTHTPSPFLSKDTPSSKSLSCHMSSISSCHSDGNLCNEEFLDEPNFKEISEKLNSSLKPKEAFMGRSVLKENLDNLKKLLRQNHVVGATPTPLLVVRNAASESVKRSLLNQYSPVKDEKIFSMKKDSFKTPQNVIKSKDVGLQVGQSPEMPSDSLHQSASSSPSLPQNINPNLTDRHILLKESKILDHVSTPKKGKSFTNAKQLLECNDIVMMEDKSRKNSQEAVFMEIDGTRNSCDDAKQLLLKNDSRKTRHCSFSTKNDNNSDISQRHDGTIKSLDDFQYLNRSSQSSAPSSEVEFLGVSLPNFQTFHRHGSCPFTLSHDVNMVNDAATISETRFFKNKLMVSQNKHVIAEVNPYSENSLSFYPGYYADSLDMTEQHQGHHMDLLDIVEEGPSSYNTVQYRTNLRDEYGNHQRIKPGNPGSIGSPTWPIPMVLSRMFPKKPVFDSPSPKLYPRRLY